MRLLPLTALCIGLLGIGPVALQAETSVAPIASGPFQDADQRHQGEGVALLLPAGDGRVVLQFTDFAVTPGPDLEVWLIEGEVPNTSTDVLEGSWLSLGPLQAPEGDQVYELPEDAMVEDFQAVVIWCEDFSVLFAVAALQ